MLCNTQGLVRVKMLCEFQAPNWNFQLCVVSKFQKIKINLSKKSVLQFWSLESLLRSLFLKKK